MILVHVEVKDTDKRLRILSEKDDCFISTHVYGKETVFFGKKSGLFAYTK